MEDYTLFLVIYFEINYLTDLNIRHNSAEILVEYFKEKLHFEKAVKILISIYSFKTCGCPYN